MTPTAEQIERVCACRDDAWRYRAPESQIISRKVVCDIVAAWEHVAQREQWQPIETAPRDGTEVLIVVPHNGKGPVAGVMLGYVCEDDGDWYDSSENARWAGPVYAPTHWMPLPEPPQCYTTIEDEKGGG